MKSALMILQKNSVKTAIKKTKIKKKTLICIAKICALLHCGELCKMYTFYLDEFFLSLTD